MKSMFLRNLKLRQILFYLIFYNIQNTFSRFFFLLHAFTKVQLNTIAFIKENNEVPHKFFVNIQLLIYPLNFFTTAEVSSINETVLMNVNIRAKVKFSNLWIMACNNEIFCILIII